MNETKKSLLTTLYFKFLGFHIQFASEFYQQAVLQPEGGPSTNLLF